jgi:hypothetical protein
MRFLKVLFLVSAISISPTVSAQKLLTDMIDTTTELGKGMLSLYTKFGGVKLSAYIQPQFQWVEEKGAKTFAGGDFPTYSNNRFMLRRSRLRADYDFRDKSDRPLVYFVFQVDATERGVVARDVWGRFFENNWQLFYVTAGLFARPMGFEINLSSSERETPERGRMSQILMRTERDVGAMLTLEPRKKGAKLNMLKADLGVFNGQGLAGTADFDSYKDIIGRVSVKPSKLKPLGLVVSAGASVLYGAVGNQSPFLYEQKEVSGMQQFVSDSTDANVDYASPRHYYGADVQLEFPNRIGSTELRAEYIRGKQSGTASSSETPGTYPVINNIPQPLYIRPFDGAYVCFLQHLGSQKHQLLVKYDWYDPNTKVSGTEISKGNGMSAADVKFNTLGVGYVYYANAHLKATFYYDMVKNEHTNISGYTSDVKDNVFTCRLQYRF